MVRYILLLFLFFSIHSISSQCIQDKKAKEFKLKAEKTSKVELKKKSAYLQFAKYYEYVCECKNGTNREEQLITLINRLVDVNKSYHFEKYGTLEKVFKCNKVINKKQP